MFSNVLDYNKIVIDKNGVKTRREGIKLYIDCIYKNKTYAQNYSGDVLSVMIPGSGLQGGFRPVGSKNGKYPTHVALFSTNKDPYWRDELDEELGLYIYYGDNKNPGSELHSKKGNRILKETYEYVSSDSFEERKKIAPFFLFDRDNIGGVRFRGLLIPGYKGIPAREWLTALWAKRDEGGRFQNYKAIFTVLDTSSGSKAYPNDASIDIRWLDDIAFGKAYESIYAPVAWKNWVKNPQCYKPLKTNVSPKIRSQADQQPKPEEREQIKMLDMIVNYFEKDRTKFEPMAIRLAMLSDNNIFEDPKQTRKVKDGGRDGIGKYRIMSGLSNPLHTTFAIEAKCKKRDNAVHVHDTARLISRIRHRQFGVFVTTSYVDEYAYKEIIEDDQPISIIAGKDIIDILSKVEEVRNCEQLQQYLEANFPKEK